MATKIYHYCRLSTALEKILPTKSLRLSPLIYTNDPRENKSFIFGAKYWKTSDIGFDGDLLKMSSEISKQIRADAKIICFAQDSIKLAGYQLSQM